MSKAFIFPGQGSQSVGMLSELAEKFSIIRDTFGEASDVLGYDLWELVSQGPNEKLNSTDKTQPAMLAAGVSIWRVWNEVSDSRPSLMAGHSLGEYTALVCANSLPLADGISLVEERGKFMQDAVPAGVGAMAAILGLEDKLVIDACANSANDEVVSAVNFNSPGQVVIAGNSDAVERAITATVNAGAKKAVRLPVSVPSHCDLMKPAAERLSEKLTNVELQMPDVPVIHNVTANVASNIDELRDLLVRQLYLPVRWVDCVNYMIEQGADEFVECGPGKVLAGLNKRIARRIPAVPVFDNASLEKALG